METKKYSKIHIHADIEMREAWEWLKANDYNCSRIVKQAVIAKVNELKAKEQANG